MRQKLMFVLFLVWASLLFADFPKVGKKAPRIDIGEWVTGKIEGKNPFVGKTIILEFWATWCAPCVAAIPHLNELATKFANRNVVFVSITDETRSVVEEFLKKKQMKSSVVIDKERNTYGAYGVTGIPHTFLLDTKGILRWHGYPTELTERFLAEFLRSGVAPKVVEPPKPVTLSENLLRGKADSNNVFLFSISTADPKDTTPGWSGWSSGRDFVDFQFHSKSTIEMISTILRIPIACIRTSGTINNQRYDVRLRIQTPIPIDSVKEEAVQMISRAAGFRIKKIKDSIKVQSMSVQNPEKLKKSVLTTSSHISRAGNIWIASGIPLNVLSKSLEDLYNIVVSYHDTTSFRCDFELPADDFQKAKTILQDHYGILLKDNLQEAEVLKLEPYENNR